MPSRIDPRGTRAWRRLRDRVVAEEPVCRLQIIGICSGASTTAAHIRPVSTHPEIAMSRSNLRGSCEPCNRATSTTPLEALALPVNPPAITRLFR